MRSISEPKHHRRFRLEWLRVGFILIGAGAVSALAMVYGVRLGRLPGDIYIKKWDFSIYMPLTTGFVVSVAMTVSYLILVQIVSQFGYSRPMAKGRDRLDR